MKKIVSTISLLSLLFVLFSCSSSDKNDSTNSGVINSGSTTNNVTIKTTNAPIPVFKERKVETKVENWKLTIWKDTTITKWKADDFPSDFPIINWWEIYKNSSMRNYAFIIEKDKSLQNIYIYYRKELEKQWYTYKNDKKIEKDNISNLEFNKWDEKINITINKDIPEILVETLKLEWTFIEIYITKIQK